VSLVFHRLIQKDLRSVLTYYTEEVGPELAEGFYKEFEQLVVQVARNPGRFHPVSGTLRRANFRRFPYHVLYRETGGGVRILVLRHHRRDPRYGLERR
jgi:plasmid stabilization system protein ParE